MMRQTIQNVLKRFERIDLLRERDPDNEIISWLETIREMATAG